jgi:AraC-like DNA-binding protein
MSVAIYLVQAVVGEVRRAGQDSTALLREVGIDPSVLDEPWQRLASDTYDQLQRRAVELTSDPAFGLHMGEHTSIAVFNLLGPMAMHSRSLREGLDVLCSYHRIMADVDPSSVVYEGDRARLVYRYLRSHDPVCNLVRAEFGITALLTLGRALIATDDARLEFWFDHPRPRTSEHQREYTRIFAGRERFEKSHTGILMPREILDARPVYHDASLYQLLKARADGILRRFERREGTARRIRELIVHEYQQVRPEMENIANRLGMSERSLRRRLQKEGRSFAQIVGEAMGEVARGLLRESTIQETAYRLGFSDASAFHRAFKRWTGQTPGEFCRSAHDEPEHLGK